MEKLPSISFFPKPAVKLAKSSWGDDYCRLTFDSANLEISLLPLLWGTIEFPTIKIDKMRFFVNTQDSFADMYDSRKRKYSANITHQAAEELKKYNFTPFLNSLLKHGSKDIILSDSSFVIREDENMFYFDGVHLDLTNLFEGETAELNLLGTLSHSTHLTQYDKYNTHIKANIEFIVLKNTIDVNMKNIQLTPYGGFNFKDPVSLTAKAKLKASPLLFTELEGDILGSFINLHFKGVNNLTTTNGEIKLTGELNPLLVTKNFMTEIQADKPMNWEHLAIDTKFVYKEQEYHLHNILIKQDDAKINGKICYFEHSDELNVELTAHNINVDNYAFSVHKTTHESSLLENITQTEQANSFLAPKTTQKKSKQNQNYRISLPNIFQKSKFEGKITLSNFVYNNYTFDNISTELGGKNSVICLNPVEIIAFQNRVNGEINLDLSLNQYINASFAIPSFDLDTFNSTLLQKDSLKGQGNAKLYFHFPINNASRSINGNGQINFSALDVQANKIPFLADILRKNNISQKNHLFSGQVHYQLKDNVFNINTAELFSKELNLSANGTIDSILKQLNLTGRVGYTKDGLELPFLLKGNLKHPQLEINLDKPIKIKNNTFELNIKNKKSSQDAVNSLLQ